MLIDPLASLSNYQCAFQLSMELRFKLEVRGTPVVVYEITD